MDVPGLACQHFSFLAVFSFCGSTFAAPSDCTPSRGPGPWTECILTFLSPCSPSILFLPISSIFPFCRKICLLVSWHLSFILLCIYIQGFSYRKNHAAYKFACRSNTSGPHVSLEVWGKAWGPTLAWQARVRTLC